MKKNKVFKKSVYTAKKNKKYSTITGKAKIYASK